MSQKKVVGRNMAIALGIVCIVLVAGIGGVMAYYNMKLNDKDSTISALQTNHTYTDDEYSTMQSNYQNAQNDLTNYKNNHHHTDGEYNSAIASKPGKLVEVGLQEHDDRPWLQTPRLHVWGYLCNVGGLTANNVKIHVVASQSGGVVAIDTYIDVGSLAGESWWYVDTNVFYNGDQLASYTTTPQWTS